MSPRRIDYLDPHRSSKSVRQQRNRTPREHGWARSEDKRAAEASEASRRSQARKNGGLPLLLCVVLAILTFVGGARVKARLNVLELADEISVLTSERDELLDRKRRLEAERAYLRRPQRVRKRATEELGMVPATPARIQSIRLLDDSGQERSLAAGAATASLTGGPQP